MCSVKETFEYTFDDVRVDARCWFYMYVGNGFFAVHFQFIFIVNCVSQKFEVFFSFSYSTCIRQPDLVCLKFFEKCLRGVLM